MSRPSLALLSSAALLSAALFERPAAASEPSPASDPVIVLLAPDLEASDVDDRAVGTLGARVRATGVKVVVVRRALSELRALAADSKGLIDTWGARGALWIDVGRAEEAALYLVTRDGEQVFGRTIPAPEGKTSATLETLANIAASVSAELLEGRIVELSPVQVPEPPPQRSASVSGPSIAPEAAQEPKPPARTEVASPAPPAPKKTQNPRPATRDTTEAAPSSSSSDDDPDTYRFPRLGLSIGYTGDTFGTTIPWQNAVSALLTLSPSRSTFLGLGYDFVIPMHIGSSPGGYDLARHPIVAVGGLRLLASRWDFGIGARMAMDILEQTPDPIQRLPPPPGSPMPPPRPPSTPEAQTQILFTAAPVVEVGYSFGGRFRAGAFFGVEALLNKPTPTAPPLDLRPDPARIIAGLSLGVDIFVPKAEPRSTTARAAPPSR